MRTAFPPGWRTFLRNHAPDIAVMDLLVVRREDYDAYTAEAIASRRWVRQFTRDVRALATCTCSTQTDQLRATFLRHAFGPTLDPTKKTPAPGAG